MSKNTVQAQVLRLNNVDYPGGHVMGVDCEGADAQGMYWAIPLANGRGVAESQYRLEAFVEGETKPSADAVKVLRVVNNFSRKIYLIALNDADGIPTWTNECSACCDDQPYVMPAVVIPDPIVEEDACPDEDGNRVFFTVADALGANQTYVARATIDGAILTPAPPAEGFATLSAFETWADANWGPNTFAISDTYKVSMTSATATSGSLMISRTPIFESNAPGALTSGQHYIANATINGHVMPTLTGAADAALSTIATAANANASWAAYGKWSVVGGKLRLVSTTATSASIVVTKA